MLQNYKKERQAPFLVHPPHCKDSNYFLISNNKLKKLCIKHLKCITIVFHKEKGKVYKNKGANK